MHDWRTIQDGADSIKEKENRGGLWQGLHELLTLIVSIPTLQLQGNGCNVVVQPVILKEQMVLP
jgi:hypothetical protein